MKDLNLFLYTIFILSVPAHAFEVATVDNPSNGSVEPPHIIDHIPPHHESRAGLGAIDLRSQFLVSIRPFF